MKRLAFLTIAAALAGPAAFAATAPAQTPASQALNHRIERQMTSGMVLHDIRTLWRQQDGSYENA